MQKGYPMTTILVIDDDRAIAPMVRSAMPEWDVLEAYTATTGLDLLRQYGHKIDVVGLDIGLPKLSGDYACVTIRTIAKNMPILPITGLCDAAIHARLRELDCAEPLIKPFNPEQLRTALLAVLAHPPAVAAPPADRAMLQEMVAEQEQAARRELQTQVLVCGARRYDRLAIGELMLSAGLGVLAELEPNGPLDTYVRTARKSETALVVATTANLLDRLAPYASSWNLPLLVIATSLAEALQLAPQLREVAKRFGAIGLVIDHPALEKTVPPAVAQTIAQIMVGETSLPDGLDAPFADAPLAPKERELVTLEMLGYTGKALARRMNIDEGTVRNHRVRVRTKFNLDPTIPITEWAEAWWFRHYGQRIAGGSG